MATLNLEISYFESQYKVFFEATSPRRVIQKGGRVGMTRGAAQAIVQMMIESDRKMYFLWGDVTLGNIKKYYETYFLPILKKLGRAGSIWNFNRQDMELRVRNSVCHFRSAEHPERWEGFGYHYIFLNEAGIILRKAQIWEQSVQKMLLDYPDSVLIAAGVPKGINMFSEMIDWAKDAKQPDWEHFHFTTYDNPTISKASIDAFVKKSPEIARQEIFGEVLGMEESLFQFIKPEWVELAFSNWIEDQQLDSFKLPPLSAVGGDPSRGRDECCLTLVHGLWVPKQVITHDEQASNSQRVASSWEAAICTAAGGKRPHEIAIPIRIDQFGVGYGVYDIMHGDGKRFKNVIALLGGANPKKRDANKVYEIANEITWWWWDLRERLDPTSKRYERIAICPDPLLKHQLCATRFEIKAGKVYREDKALTKERLGGASPDRAESLVYALCDKRKKGTIAW